VAHVHLPHFHPTVKGPERIERPCRRAVRRLEALSVKQALVSPFVRTNEKYQALRGCGLVLNAMLAHAMNNRAHEVD
jgi:hypothetical protein